MDEEGFAMGVHEWGYSRQIERESPSEGECGSVEGDTEATQRGLRSYNFVRAVRPVKAPLRAVIALKVKSL